MFPLQGKNALFSVLLYLSDAGKGTLRHLAGVCVAKSRYHYMKYANTNLYNSKTPETVSKSFFKVKMLDSVVKHHFYLEENSIYKETLYETKRRQNLS